MPKKDNQSGTDDRAIAAFVDMESVTTSKKYLANLIKKWVAAAV